MSRRSTAFVEVDAWQSSAVEAGHHEARIAAAGARQPLGLGHHPAAPAPRVQAVATEPPVTARRGVAATCAAPCRCAAAASQRSERIDTPIGEFRQNPESPAPPALATPEPLFARSRRRRRSGEHVSPCGTRHDSKTPAWPPAAVLIPMQTRARRIQIQPRRSRRSTTKASQPAVLRRRQDQVAGYRPSGRRSRRALAGHIGWHPASAQAPHATVMADPHNRSPGPAPAVDQGDARPSGSRWSAINRPQCCRTSNIRSASRSSSTPLSDVSRRAYNRASLRDRRKTVVLQYNLFPSGSIVVATLTTNSTPCLSPWSSYDGTLARDVPPRPPQALRRAARRTRMSELRRQPGYTSPAASGAVPRSPAPWPRSPSSWTNRSPASTRSPSTRSRASSSAWPTPGSAS